MQKSKLLTEAEAALDDMLDSFDRTVRTIRLEDIPFEEDSEDSEGEDEPPDDAAGRDL